MFKHPAQPSESASFNDAERPLVVVCPACHRGGTTRSVSPDWGRNYLCPHCGEAWAVKSSRSDGVPLAR